MVTVPWFHIGTFLCDKRGIWDDVPKESESQLIREAYGTFIQEAGWLIICVTIKVHFFIMYSAKNRKVPYTFCRGRINGQGDIRHLDRCEGMGSKKRHSEQPQKKAWHQRAEIIRMAAFLRCSKSRPFADDLYNVPIGCGR